MLTIYGVPNSQPVRAVVWTCLMKGLPFELRMTSQNRDAKRPDYLAGVNPPARSPPSTITGSCYGKATRS